MYLYIKYNIPGAFIQAIPVDSDIPYNWQIGISKLKKNSATARGNGAAPEHYNKNKRTMFDSWLMEKLSSQQKP